MAYRATECRLPSITNVLDDGGDAGGAALDWTAPRIQTVGAWTGELLRIGSGIAWEEKCRRWYRSWKCPVAYCEFGKMVVQVKSSVINLV